MLWCTGVVPVHLQVLNEKGVLEYESIVSSLCVFKRKCTMCACTPCSVYLRYLLTTNDEVREVGMPVPEYNPSTNETVRKSLQSTSTVHFMIIDVCIFIKHIKLFTVLKEYVSQ